MNISYMHDRAQLMFAFDVAFRFIQTGGDKYIEEVVRIITAGIENSARLVTAPAKEFGLLHLCPRIYLVNVWKLSWTIFGNTPSASMKTEPFHIDAVYNSPHVPLTNSLHA